MISRRALFLAAAVVITPVPGEAQPAGKVHRIGYLNGATRPANQPFLEQFQQSLRGLGYIEGQNLVVEYRWADGKQERLPELAAELTRLKLDLIVAPVSPAARAAQQATRTIPIVMVAVGDPIGLGLVASLARPGGNVTGTASYLPELGAKPLELLKEILGDVKRLAVLWNPANPLHAGVLRDLERPSRSLGIQLQPLKIVTADDLDGAFREAKSERAAAVWVFGDPMLGVHRSRIAALALDTRLPTLGVARQQVDVGGLMSYGPDIPVLYRRAAHYVDRILKGAKPADLPVEQPTKFELVINAKTAKTLGLTIPPSLLLRADQVIE